MYFLILLASLPSLRRDSKSSAFKGFFFDSITKFPGSNIFFAEIQETSMHCRGRKENQYDTWKDRGI